MKNHLPLLCLIVLVQFNALAAVGQGKTCDEVGGVCMSKGLAKRKCTERVDTKFTCDGKKVCCISETNECIAYGDYPSVLLKKVESSELAIKQGVAETKGSVEVKIQDLRKDLQSHQESVNSTLDYIIKLLKQLSNDLEAVKENITKVAATTQAPTTTSTEAPITGPSNKNTEVNFLTVGGTAKATSTWDDGIYAPLRGFAQPGYTWHSSSSSRLPQSIWYEFPQALRVVKYSFQGRTDPPYAPYPDTAPSSYVFWASNSIECSKIEARVALVVDTSDTPFTNENIPKVVDVENPVYYRCYGFTITETPGRTYVGMSNIRLFYNKD